MSSGKRYNYDGQKINMKKVVSLILVLVIIILLIVSVARNNSNKGNTTVAEKTVTTSYFPVYTNGKWGVIDSKGNTIIDAIYDSMIVVPDPSQEVFITQTNVSLTDGTYTSNVINAQGENLYSGFDSVEMVQNVDANGVIYYDTNILKVKKDNKYGMIDAKGATLLECQYDSIEPISNIKNSYIIKQSGKVGLVDQSGNIIINPEYKEITALTDKYEDGYVVLNDSGKYGIINYNKKQVLEFKYNEIKHVTGSGYYVVKTDDSLKIIDSKGESTNAAGFDDVVAINNSRAVIKKDNKYGVISVDGESEIAAEYDSIKYLFDDYYAVVKNNEASVVDTDGETKLSGYSGIYYYSEQGFVKAEKSSGSSDLMDTNFEIKASGIVTEINAKNSFIRVRTSDGEYKYYNFQLEEKSSKDVYPANTLFLQKKDGKYGYVNKNGKVAVEYQFDDATEQNEYGYAAVKKDGKWGAIDSTGKLVVEFNYELKNNTIIDFIGKYHLATDTNAWYYTDIEE